MVTDFLGIPARIVTSPTKSIGSFFCDHVGVSILKFVNYPVLPAGDDAKRAQFKIFLMNDGSRRTDADGVTVL